MENHKIEFRDVNFNQNWFECKKTVLDLKNCLNELGYYKGAQNELNASLCPPDRWSLEKPCWMLQISSYFMTLFLLTFPRSPWCLFPKKVWKFWKIRKKTFIWPFRDWKFFFQKLDFFKKSYFFCQNLISKCS